ncbi:hypothetical protein TI05_09910, partial [Achromatium sp. WMS3]
MISRYFNIKILIIILGIMLGGCSSLEAPPPSEAPKLARPEAKPKPTWTDFTESLECMDKLFLAHGKKGFVVTTAGIPDSTGKVSVSTKEMLHLAASDMSVRSKALKFIDYDTSSTDLLVLFEDLKKAGADQIRELPQYYIRGAISQLDENVITQQKSAGIAADFIDLGASKDRISSVITVDMNVANTVTREILPGISSSNSLVITRSGNAKEAGAKIGKVGLSFSMSANVAESPGAGTRALIQLGMIEVMGKLLEVPYWKCLGMKNGNADTKRHTKYRFRIMPVDKKIMFVQRRLNSAKMYSGPIDGKISSKLNTAIKQFQSKNKLSVTGDIDFDLYYALFISDFSTASIPDEGPKAIVTDQPPSLPITATITTDTNGKYQTGDTLTARVKATGDGFLFCYYKQVSGEIARIFPNRFDPNPAIKGDTEILLPSKSAPFKIRFFEPGNESITCYASHIDMTVPENIKGEDLQPLSIRTMDEIGAAFKKSNPEYILALFSLRCTNIIFLSTGIIRNRYLVWRFVSALP